MKVDAHCHWYPQEYLKEIETLGGDSLADRAWRKIMTDKVAVTPSMWSVEDRLADMDASGIDVQVLSLSIPNVYFEDAAKSLYLAQVANDCYAELSRKYPDRFIGLASVPLTSPEAAVDELRRAIDQLGLRGLALGANVRGRPLNSEEFLPLYEEADRRNLVIFIHPMIPAGIEIMERYDLAASTGYLFDSTIAITGMVFRGIFERFKNITMLLPHLGAVIPYTIGRIDASFRTRPECRQHLSSPPSEYFKRFYYDTVNSHVPALRCAADTFGADRLLLASDHPFALGKISQIISAIEALGLGEEREAMIFGGTAMRIFGEIGGHHT
ncbi:MAG: amidohydrolase [Chloroflexi bacterium]|nr:amidohydrolase [Chloroflexota bacterium]